ncbi:MAG TPA: hypothetical protein VJM33_06235 [Microthrixaceae bacterium]|nr:hypothetical protein [Microthrixaceae bacterium]
MKRALRRALDRVGHAVSSVQVRWCRWRGGGRRVTVIDIDNTLADAWPSYLVEWSSHRDRLRSLTVLPGMRVAAHDAALARGDLVVFLSHRNWWEWGLTRRWLHANGFAVGVANLVLVASPADKIDHLTALSEGGPVAVWDDLTHAQETGEPQQYAEVVDAFAMLGVEHHGFAEIEAIVEAAGGR